jgi:hypothetical protein
MKNKLITTNKNAKRKKPGTGGGGKFYRIELKDKDRYESFRYHDVGEKGGDLERLAGKKEGGEWETQSWLVNKNSAHVNKGKLVPESSDVKELFSKLISRPKQIKGDIFSSKEKNSIKKK